MVTLHDTEYYRVFREGRFLLCEFKRPFAALSTSALNGGAKTHLTHFLNHQSGEGTGHEERHHRTVQLGPEHYHREVCAEAGVDPEITALMGTAANMQYASCAARKSEDMEVAAVVTAGVQGNAGRAGDPAKWNEEKGQWTSLSPMEGTINTMLMFNVSLSDGALARAVVTMTEAKSAALEELSVGSRYSRGLATGTGTDQYCVGAPLESSTSKTWAGGHTRLGELIGKAVKEATLEALRWQNGMEPSYTRGLLHILGRFGLTRPRFLEILEQVVSRETAWLVRGNIDAVLFDPQISACAWALGVLQDKVAYGAVSEKAGEDLINQYGALLISQLSGRPDDYPDSLRKLSLAEGSPMEKIVRAIGLGWERKWA